MLIYLLKMIACSAAFYALYFFLFQKEKMLVFNRFYLLGALITPFLIPLITFTVTVPAVQAPVVYATDAYTFAHLQQTAPQVADYTKYVALIVYAIVSLILIMRFVINLLRIRRTALKSGSVYFNQTRIALLNGNAVPYSFLNTIFVNKVEYEVGGVEVEVLEHELAHVRQKHSWDILFVEILQVFCWFNPVIYLYKRSIKINHELLADAAVVKKFGDVRSYQSILLQRAVAQPALALASSFNFFTTKKRLVMLQKKFRKRHAIVAGFLVVPLLVGLIVFAAKRVYAQAHSENLPQANTDTVPAPPAPPFSRETQYKFNEWPVIMEYSAGNKVFSYQIKDAKLPQGAKNLVYKASINSVNQVVILYDGFKSVIEDVSNSEKRTAVAKKYGIKIPETVATPSEFTPPIAVGDLSYGPGASDDEVAEYVSAMKTVTETKMIKVSKAKELETIYKKMNKEQRNAVLPPPSPNSLQNGATDAEMKEYAKILLMIDKKSNHLKTDVDYNKRNVDVEKAANIYNKMSKEQKPMVKMPPPKIVKDKEVKPFAPPKIVKDEEVQASPNKFTPPKIVKDDEVKITEVTIQEIQSTQSKLKTNKSFTKKFAPPKIVKDNDVKITEVTIEEIKKK